MNTQTEFVPPTDVIVSTTRDPRFAVLLERARTGEDPLTFQTPEGVRLSQNSSRRLEEEYQKSALRDPRLATLLERVRKGEDPSSLEISEGVKSPRYFMPALVEAYREYEWEHPFAGHAITRDDMYAVKRNSDDVRDTINIVSLVRWEGLRSRLEEECYELRMEKYRFTPSFANDVKQVKPCERKNRRKKFSRLRFSKSFECAKEIVLRYQVEELSSWFPTLV